MTHHHKLFVLHITETQPWRNARHIDLPTLLAWMLGIVLPWLLVVGMVVLVVWLFIRGGGA